ncbi:hypothetical protein T484DRAFT_3634737, partial [Baffinella frigidus]
CGGELGKGGDEHAQRRAVPVVPCHQQPAVWTKRLQQGTRNTPSGLPTDKAAESENLARAEIRMRSVAPYRLSPVFVIQISGISRIYLRQHVHISAHISVHTSISRYKSASTRTYLLPGVTSGKAKSALIRARRTACSVLSGFRIPDSRFEIRDSGFAFRDSGFGIQV